MTNKPYCVIGDPVAHSISPPIHKAVFTYIGLEADYTAVHVSSDELSDFILDARQNQRPGFNVTIPHKETIMSLLDRIDPPAQNIGAVNTVHLYGNQLIGYNTDVLGCMAALKREGFASDGKAVLIGAGGAARAGLEAVARFGMAGCTIFDLYPEKADALVSHFKQFHSLSLGFGSIGSGDLESRVKEADLVINASPVGMWPNVDKTPLPDPSCIQKGTWVFDMVYTPLETRLLSDARQAGAIPISGLSMLVAQAIEADAIFLNRTLPSDLFDHVFEMARNLMEQKRTKL
ncbi:shikimate dehydrogenase [candidate division KSB1 bacterium]|nr:shikimate dehydrogenase [candidate division KSB1 bacterium]